jgi:hypothetical protein
LRQIAEISPKNAVLVDPTNYSYLGRTEVSVLSVQK